MTNRNYGIDLLRITSMILITSFHIISPGMGQYAFYNGTLSIKILYAICSCGVNCFLLISGYVNLKSDFKISRIIKLLLEALFYNVSLTISVSLLNGTMSLSRVIESLDVFGSGGWWFLRSYLILFIMMPFINAAIKNINKSTLAFSLIAILLLLSIYTLFKGDVFYTGNGYSALWFAIVYTIGAYISLYTKNIKTNNLFLCTLFIISTLITVSSFYIIYYYNGIHLDSYISEELLFLYTSPTILINSVILLFLFKDIKIKNKISQIIKFITPSIFAAYLIQCQHYIYRFYFPDLFSFLNKYNNKLLIYIPLIGVLIIVLLIIVDLIRRFLAYILKINNLYKYIDSRFNNAK